MVAQIRNGLAMLAVAAATAAVAQNNEVPVQIEADRAELARNDGKSLYIGNVVLTRGALELRGDRLAVEREGGEIHAVLTGRPARVTATPEDGAPIRGRAAEITYASGDEVVMLSGDAHIERGGDAISGMTIRHNLATARTEATRGDNERVRITIHPETADTDVRENDGG